MATNQHKASMSVIQKHKANPVRAVPSISFTAPWPPTVNHYWMRNKMGGMRISKAGLAYRQAVAWACHGEGKVSGKCTVLIHANPPDRRKRDLDNVLKALLDAIAKGGAIDDDFDIQEITIRRGMVDPEGRVYVEINGASEW